MPRNGADLLSIFKALQYEKAKVQSGDTATWDLSLLVKALLRSKPPFVTDPLRVAALTCLRDMRNKLCHATTPKLGTADFEKMWLDACSGLRLFGAQSQDFDQVATG